MAGPIQEGMSGERKVEIMNALHRLDKVFKSTPILNSVRSEICKFELQFRQDKNVLHIIRRIILDNATVNEADYENLEKELGEIVKIITA